MHRITFVFIGLLVGLSSHAQTELFKKSSSYSHQDSLRGSITPERAWWDLKHYDLFVSVDVDARSISGKNIVRYEVLESMDVMQIDLQSPMKIIRVLQDGKTLNVIDDGNAHFIQLKRKQRKGETGEITIEFAGTPLEAANAPWDGGFSWKNDSNGKPFVATSNQVIGASLWWPCKDHAYDEPDEGQLFSINVPEDLIAVSNGRLVSTETRDNGTKTFIWKVINPINNYGTSINIGEYVNFKDTYRGEQGDLDMDFWVLRENEEKAREHFGDQVPKTLEAFEHWFGPYPFYEDSYKLVEVPYLGMEHQSAVTYGNGYQNGFLGRGSVWGLKWDYIIIHETAHEWFANNLTYKDAADMWIHEGFACYSENLFTEYFYGKKAGAEYVIGLRRRIRNQEPLIGDYDVNKEGSGDMYNKGANILHTLRQIVNDDEKWRATLRGLNKNFYHQTVTTKQVEDYISKSVGIDLRPFFDQYLRDHRIPTLEYKVEEGTVSYRWADVIDSFTMPVDVLINNQTKRLNPIGEWQDVSGFSIEVDFDYYVNTRKL